MSLLAAMSDIARTAATPSGELLGRPFFAALAPSAPAAQPEPSIEIIDASRTMTDAGPVLDDWQAAIGGTLILGRMEAFDILPRALFDRVEDAADAAARKAEEIQRDRDADVRAFRNHEGGRK